MNKGLITLVVSSLLLAGCTDYLLPKSSRAYLCQGADCIAAPGKLMSYPGSHKPTKDEKIRARQGLDPNFGSEEFHLGISFPSDSEEEIPILKSLVF